MKNRYLRPLIFLLGIIILAVCIYFAVLLAGDIQAYSVQVQQRYDYTKITTPLPNSVVNDICTKFELSPKDKRCQPNSIVYGPDFFEDIQNYLQKVPDEEKTYRTVQEKLGNYQVLCETPDNKGHYACRYDLRGDGIYPIGIFFDKEDHYFWVIANIGGS